METLKEDIEEIYEKLRHEYEHHRGTEPRGFSRNYLYKNHVKNKMAQLREVAFETLSRVAQLVEKSLEAVLEKDANKFSLLEPITAEVKAVFEMQKADCEQFLRTTFKMEKMPFICDYNLAKVPVEVTMAQEQRCLFTQYNLSTGKPLKARHQKLKIHAPNFDGKKTFFFLLFSSRWAMVCIVN